ASNQYGETGILIGAVQPAEDDVGRGIYNSAVLIYRGEVVFEQHKSLLPAYDVFDEVRYFDPAKKIEPFPFKGEKLGISICEDAWTDPELCEPGKYYSCDPIETLVQKGATLLINLSASPFQLEKEEVRYNLIRSHALRYKLPIVYVNQVGGNDELVFDGRSVCLNRGGEPLAVLPSFKEHVETVDMNGPVSSAGYAPLEKIQSVYEALALGTRDYVRKTGFSQAVVGLSGGIDSAVTLCLAVEALGPENVLSLAMPSPYSSRGSLEDAEALAANLGVEFKIIPISNIFESYLESWKEPFAGKAPDVTEENIQARIRGNILMAFSNKFGYFLLTTGNKSELALGYCTLYGDMCGGLAVIADVPKTMVYDLAGYINRNAEIIPRGSIEKPPSAELRPNQRDEDSLPSYDILDQILYYYIEEGYSIERIVKQGFDLEMVKWVIKTMNRNEFKRKQAAPGLKVTSKAFGIGRKMPIVARHDF
ncbi:MAG: NAD+ synthase, partial [Deltaproteobacteria bacterium]|nr:NAD+ synthase [Deltaproteobacteria bacterium]MBW2141810.1 NAD+ synthase [Deltaproteobacteria bacterium]